MGAFIVKQPNGLYCRFSTVVDCPTHYNMTEEEYIQVCVDKAIEEATREAKDTLKHWVQPFEDIKKHFYDGNMSIEDFQLILKDMGDEEGLGEEKIEQLKKLKER